jgi:hypothetical protein
LKRMSEITLEFRVSRLDEEYFFLQAIVPASQLLGTFIACDLLTVDACDELRSLLDVEDFSYWGEATRVISEAGEDVRVYQPGSSLYSTVPRSLLSQVLDEWSRFVLDHEERSFRLEFEPTVLEITDESNVLVGSFESELAQYFEGNWDEHGYIDTGVVSSWIPNSEQYETIIGSHYALALTEDGRWVVIDDRRRIGGGLRCWLISGSQAREWMDRNKIHYSPGEYPFD